LTCDDTVSNSNGRTCTGKNSLLHKTLGDICRPNPKKTRLRNASPVPLGRHDGLHICSSYQLTINALEPLGDVVLGLNGKGAPSCVYARQREDDGDHGQRYQRRILLNISHKRSIATFSCCLLMIVVVALNRAE